MARREKGAETLNSPGHPVWLGHCKQPWQESCASAPEHNEARTSLLPSASVSDRLDRRPRLVPVHLESGREDTVTHHAAYACRQILSELFSIDL